ncbi:MAG: extracellular solute-binding protein [Clostridia bacterium]|nr:extracellular solute-binding protein [Clostridia bacterium]
MKKRIVSIILASCTLSSVAFAACGGGGGEKIDPNRTQLYVNVRNCGIGTEFAYNLKSAYEAKNPKVQVMITTDDTLDDEGLQSLKTNDDVDVIFAPNYILNDFVSVNNGTSEYFADITDIVTDGGNQSIMSKMYKDEKEYHNVGTESAPKFFSLPWYVSYHGTVYDVDLFEEKNFYNIDGYTGIDCVEGTEDDFWGPDGKENTYDDGLPGTWEDMKILMDEMVAANVTPFTWTSYKGYSDAWLCSVWANYEGAANYALLGDFEGTYTYSQDTDWLSGGVAGSNGGKELSVTTASGYTMAFQNGKKAALEVAEYIVTNNLYSAQAIGSTQNHYEAQTEYLTSVELSKKNSNVQRIAFLMEGNWWENEAKETFKDMEVAYHEKYAYGTRRFGYFPWPKFLGSSDIPDQVNLQTTLMGGTVEPRTNVCAINKISPNLEIAKDFVKFAYSDEGNASFTTSCGVLRPFDYELTTEQLNSLTYYQQSLYKLSRETTTAKVSGYARTGLIYTSADYISGCCKFAAKNELNETFSDPFNTFATKSNMTAEKYLDFVKIYVDAKTNFWK